MAIDPRNIRNIRNIRNPINHESTSSDSNSTRIQGIWNATKKWGSNFCYSTGIKDIEKLNIEQVFSLLKESEETQSKKNYMKLVKQVSDYFKEKYQIGKRTCISNEKAERWFTLSDEQKDMLEKLEREHDAYKMSNLSTKELLSLTDWHAFDVEKQKIIMDQFVKKDLPISLLQLASIYPENIARLSQLEIKKIYDDVANTNYYSWRKLNQLEQFACVIFFLKYPFICHINSQIKQLFQDDPVIFKQLPIPMQLLVLDELLKVDHKVCLSYALSNRRYALQVLKQGRSLLIREFVQVDENLQTLPAHGVGARRHAVTILLEAINRHCFIPLREGGSSPTIKEREGARAFDLKFLGRLFGLIYETPDFNLGKMYPQSFLHITGQFRKEALDERSFESISLEDVVNIIQAWSKNEGAFNRIKDVINYIQKNGDVENQKERIEATLAFYLQEHGLQKYLEGDKLNSTFRNKLLQGDKETKKEALFSLISERELGVIKSAFYIATGMVRNGADWDAMRRTWSQTGCDLEEKIQGSIDRDLIVQRITHPGDHAKQQAEWLKKWIKEDATEAQCQDFLQFITGARGLSTAANAKPFTIRSFENNPNIVERAHADFIARTCFNQLLIAEKVINTANTYREFIGAIEFQISDSSDPNMNIE